ncbi:YaiO family outer membrane beta-barrel protein [Candidatus Cloacimonadota bacterium]
MRKKIALLLIFILAFTAATWSEVFLHRIETSIQYEYLNPDSLYDSWNSLTVKYFREVNPTFNYHVGASIHNRNDSALLLFAGIGKTLSKRWFTNLAVSTSTKCDYLQQFRFDADINVILFRQENLIATLGYAWINYHTEYEDVLWRYGLSYIISRFVFEFMIFENTSTPGKVESSTALFSLGYGIDGWQWTHMVFNFGNQAYWATNYVLQNSDEIILKHRHWLKKDFGWFASLGFLDLGEAYEKYLIEFGLFWQY